MERTLDASVVIEERSAGYVRYRNAEGRRWDVRGECNQCGLCVVGAARDHYVWHGSPGNPFAVSDVRVELGRLDEPVAPGFNEAMEFMARTIPGATVAGCSLRVGDYQ